MHRHAPNTFLPLLLLPWWGSCAWWMPSEELAPAREYVSAAVEELGKGHMSLAEDIILRARQRYPDDEFVLRWSVEMHRMRWRNHEALDLLLDLARKDDLETIHQREVIGQVGDIMFELGRYGESAHYLRSGSGAKASDGDQRTAKAFITLALPYVRRNPNFTAREVGLFEGAWPEMLCGFGDKSRVCVLDTGSSMCTFAMSLARDVGVTDIRDFGLVRDSLGRNHGAWIGVLPRLAIGGIEIGPLPVLLVEDERMRLRDSFGGPENPPMGIIGLDVISRFGFTMDMTGRLARFEKPRRLAADSVEKCLSVEGCLLLPVQVEGVSMWFILDTAASHSSLTDVGLKSLPGGSSRAIPDYRHPKSLGGRSIISRKVSGIVVQTSAVKFTNVALPVVERLSAGNFPVHGVLGADLLGRCRLTLSLANILLEQVGPISAKPPDRR